MLMVRAPVNPRERNFWQLLSKHRDKIPQETYDYVFYIISAAVIGENPRMFGFNFDNPLADVGNNQSLVYRQKMLTPTSWPRGSLTAEYR